MVEYVGKAVTVWFMGFVPVSEIIIAVPAGIALGLGYVSVVIWAVFGNFLPVLLISYGYEHLQKIERVRGWLAYITSEKAKQWINQYGSWAIIIVTPWVGVWAMTVVAKTLGMSSQRLIAAAFASITLYAVGISLLIAMGSGLF